MEGMVFARAVSGALLKDAGALNSQPAGGLYIYEVQCLMS